MTDFLICSLPSLIIDRVPGAPALLKSAAESAGYTARSLDLNLEFYINQCDQNFDQFIKFSRIFQPNEPYNKEIEPSKQAWIDDSLTSIREINPKVLGLSVFSIMQHRATIMIAEAVRKHMPEVKIVIGGFGINVNANSLAPTDKFKKFDLLKPFYQLCTEQKLVDQVLFGTDLDQVIRYLQEICEPTEQTIKFESKGVQFNTPIPNYDDYKLDHYLWNDGKSLPVTGSRGCVRSCTFCDVPGQFGRFSYRSGQHIAEEIIELKKRYGINKFEFTDSLVNGSMKAFKEWLTVLANYNDSCVKEQQVTWFGQYITRPQAHVPKDLYSLMKRSGVINLIIGVESGSDEVLEAMKKQMTVKDVYDELEKFKENGISMQMLMLSGFYNETEKRYYETLEFLTDVQKYVAHGVITKISVGVPLFINELMHLGEKTEQLHIEIDPYNDRNWRSLDDESNTLFERIKRRFITQLVLDKLGIPMSANSIINMHQIFDDLKQIENQLLANESV